MRELDIITLAKAAELLGRSATTLRHQVTTGRLRATKIGKTWVTTIAEVERYRRESSGQPGRPETTDAIVVGQVPWPFSYGDATELSILGFPNTPGADVVAVTAAARDAIDRGAWTVAEVVAGLRADPRTIRILVTSGGPTSIALPRIRAFEDVTGTAEDMERNILRK